MNNLRKFVVAGAILPLLAGSALAQIPIQIVNNSGSSAFITFSVNPGSSFGVSYVDASSNKKQSVALDKGTGFSTSIPLNDVKDGTFNVTELVNGGFYISYDAGLSAKGKTLAAAPSAVDPSNPNFSTRFFQIETYIPAKQDGDNGDFSAVNLFSAAGNVTDYVGTTAGATAGFGKASSGSIFQDLYSALQKSGELGSNTQIGTLTGQSVITKPGSKKGTREFVRVLSPSNWGQIALSGGGLGYSVGPYKSFEPYVKSLYNNGNPQLTTLSNTIQTGTQSFNGGTYPSGLRYVYTFTATPTVTSGKVKNYSFSLNGSITVYKLPATNTTPLATIENLGITLPLDTGTSAELSYLIYAQSNSFTTNTTFSSDWASSGIASVDLATLQQEVLGDLEEGMLCGFVGSTTVLTAKNTLASIPAKYLKPNTMLKDVPSNIWWTYYSGKMYSAINTYYSTYSSVIYPAGNLYSAPFDDRFTGGGHNPDIPVSTSWKIVLNPNGTLTVPSKAD